VPLADAVDTDTLDADVVVLGAGPAGLATALVAARHRLQVVVVERAPRVGGLAASIEVAGQRVDLGSHRLHPAMPAPVRAELDRLLGGDLQVRPRRGRIRLDGRWLAFPLRPLDLLRHAPPQLLAGAARDTLTAPLRLSCQDSFASAVRTGLGPTIAERFYLPYARKLWDVEPEQLSAELYRRRVSSGSTGRLLRKVVRGAHPGSRTFLYPRLGFGELSERLAADAVAAGADIRLGATVCSVAEGAGQWRIGTRGGPSVVARAVVSTLPASVLAPVLDPAPPPGVGAAASRLVHRGALLVYLTLPVARYTPFDAHYLPDPVIPVARLSEPKNYRDGPDPPDRTVLCAEVPATPGDARWALPDVELAATVAESAARSGLPPLDPVEVHVVRLPHVYPVYRLGHEADQAMVESWIGERPGLLLVGRQALFAHDNTHHAITMGWTAGAALRPDATIDSAYWAAARATFRDHVVED
jgi:protoporphyrinogen oxidase